jgi:hypothetical protein
MKPNQIPKGLTNNKLHDFSKSTDAETNQTIFPNHETKDELPDQCSNIYKSAKIA